jgi:hypothetical protein
MEKIKVRLKDFIIGTQYKIAKVFENIDIEDILEKIELGFTCFLWFAFMLFIISMFLVVIYTFPIIAVILGFSIVLFFGIGNIVDKYMENKLK